ncbi:MAG: hypothetical protein LBQ94_02270 [Treponema sp.]|jgi:hypothetical protein|nr:hypothetical protein [Treponema sp.]
MKRSLAFFALFVLMGTVAFAQTRDNTSIYVQSAADNPSQRVFFRDSFEAEIEANEAKGYRRASAAASADYILNLTVRPNNTLNNDGTWAPAAPTEKQFVLQLGLFSRRDNVEIVAFPFLFTDMTEVDRSSCSFLFYQISTYLPVSVPDYAPAPAPSVPEVTGTSPPPPDGFVGPERIIRDVPGSVSPEELARIQAEALEQVRREEQERQAAEAQALREEQERQAALAKVLEDARQAERERVLREEQERQEAQAQALREEQAREAELERVRAAARAAALEEARQERLREEELARQEQARQEERAREEARVQALEQALKEAQAASIREVPIPYEVEVYRDREVPVPYVVEVPVEVIREVQVPVEVIKEVPSPTENGETKNSNSLAAGSDSWRNKRLYFRVSADIPVSYFMVKSQNSSFESRFIMVPGGTLGLEVLFFDHFGAELDLIARFAADRFKGSFMPGAGLQFKFPFKPGNLMIEPYLGAAFMLINAGSFINAPRSATPWYLEAGGGFQLGFKAGPGALFFDLGLMYTLNNDLNSIISAVPVISTTDPTTYWSRFGGAIGIGYKFGFVDRK